MWGAASLVNLCTIKILLIVRTVQSTSSVDTCLKCSTYRLEWCVGGGWMSSPELVVIFYWQRQPWPWSHDDHQVVMNIDGGAWRLRLVGLDKVLKTPTWTLCWGGFASFWPGEAGEPLPWGGRRRDKKCNFKRFWTWCPSFGIWSFLKMMDIKEGTDRAKARVAKARKKTGSLGTSSFWFWAKVMGCTS